MERCLCIWCCCSASTSEYGTLLSFSKWRCPPHLRLCASVTSPPLHIFNGYENMFVQRNKLCVRWELTIYTRWVPQLLQSALLYLSANILTMSRCFARQKLPHTPAAVAWVCVARHHCRLLLPLHAAAPIIPPPVPVIREVNITYTYMRVFGTFLMARRICQHVETLCSNA